MLLSKKIGIEHTTIQWIPWNKTTIKQNNHQTKQSSNKTTLLVNSYISNALFACSSFQKLSLRLPKGKKSHPGYLPRWTRRETIVIHGVRYFTPINVGKINGFRVSLWLFSTRIDGTYGILPLILTGRGNTLFFSSPFTRLGSPKTHISPCSLLQSHYMTPTQTSCTIFERKFLRIYQQH